MSMQRNGYRQYNQVQIQTANRGKLIVMLYQGAIRNLNKAMVRIDQGDMEGKGNALIRAQDIVLELLYALDQQMLENGNELALNLQRIYLYAYRRLVAANIQVDRKIVKEIVVLLTELLEAWESVVSGEHGADRQATQPVGVTLTA